VRPYLLVRRAGRGVPASLSEYTTGPDRGRNQRFKNTFPRVEWEREEPQTERELCDQPEMISLPSAARILILPRRRPAP
jgi:hypothetical protein